MDRTPKGVGLLGLLSLAYLYFLTDEEPFPDDDLKLIRREVPAARNGFYAVRLEEGEVGLELLRGREDPCEPFEGGWDLQVAEETFAPASKSSGDAGRLERLASTC